MESYSYEEGENCHEKSKIWFSITWIILYVGHIDRVYCEKQAD